MIYPFTHCRAPGLLPVCGGWGLRINCNKHFYTGFCVDTSLQLIWVKPNISIIGSHKHFPLLETAKLSSKEAFLFCFTFPSGSNAAAAATKSLQSCPTLCDPRDDSPWGFPVPGILQARTLLCQRGQGQALGYPTQARGFPSLVQGLTRYMTQDKSSVLLEANFSS